jgi:methyl-accepting chemotaxis protein
MLDGLRGMIETSKDASGQLGEQAEGNAASSEEVNASMEQLTSIAQELSQNAALQNDRAEQIARMTGEMMGVIEKSFEEANRGAELSQATSDLSAEGRRDASSAVERMELVQGIILEAAEAIKVLGTKTSEIFNIVDVIKRISDQTNLLALNAAIEAAKAHEFGKGFGVVADEVRKLAAESAAASDRIANLARQIQADSEGSVEYMEKSSQEMAAGMDSVRQTGRTLESILESALKTTELSDAIAAITRQAAEKSNAVMEALEEISSIAETNAASSQEIAASIEEQSSSMEEVVASSQTLADLAERLQENSRRFQTE